MDSNLNTGHGHVRPRPDGVKARCGGPGLCPDCRRELSVSQLGLPKAPAPQLTEADIRRIVREELQNMKGGE